jgi:hypothetical protein
MQKWRHLLTSEFAAYGAMFQRFRLKVIHRLDPNSTYEVSSVNDGQTQQVSGEDLLQKGLSVTIPDQPGAAAITYTKKP